MLRKYLVLFLGLFAHLSFGQNSITSELYSDLTAFESFQARKYQNVIGNLESKNKRTNDEDILLLLSKLKTGNGDALQVTNWLTKNPKHPIKPLANYHLGEYYFYSKDTLKSKKYLSSVKPSDLTKGDKASYGYVYGLLKLDDGKYKDAKNLFQFARKNEFTSTVNLDYYEGFSDYHLGDRDAALQGFSKVEHTEEFGSSSKFFIAKMRLEKGEIDEVIGMAQNELSDDKTITNSGFNQLIGEAYALKNEEAKADAFFERAIELHPSKPSAALYYQAGVSKFKIGNEDLAIEFLTESGIRGGQYAQLSAFQLGRLHLKKQEFDKALSAYIEASESDNEVIKEESYYQAAKINARLGNFTDAINYAADYLNTFEASEKKESMQNLIAQSYLRTSNFDLAIEHLTNTGITNRTQQEVYQKVTYQKAVLAFNDANFGESDQWFKESLKYPLDGSLKNAAYYHLAEIAMRNNRLDDAINYYKKQTVINPISHYGIGYAYYNKQQYSEAIPHFSKVGSEVDANIRLDAKVRLADCLYATKSYQLALDVYNGLTRETSSAYLTFQRGMALKSLGKGSEAISMFGNIPAESRYKGQALFQSGMIKFESANFSEAQTYFSQVINNHSNSRFVVESLLNRGISKKNMGDLNGAKEDYETIVKTHVDSEVALNAILGLQELQQSGLKVQNLDKYIAQYKDANPKDGSLEFIEFEAAKRLYFDFSYQEAAEAFGAFLTNYPGSGSKIEAQYYQADSYYRIDDLVNAKPVFEELTFVRNSYTGRILNRLGEVNKRLNSPEESEKAYKLLIDIDLTPKYTYNALQGLMFLYFDIEHYNDAITYASKIIEADWKPLNGDQEAMVFQARSWFLLGDVEKAKESYELLAETNDANGAEANYYLGLISHQAGDYEKSLDILFDLNANYGSYTQWVDKSYLLIARDYVAMDELFQAKATLRSIIQHSKNQEIKDESQKLLDSIEQNSAQTDSTQIKD